MATLRAAFKARLVADTALMTLLTGGITDAADTDPDGGSASEAPRETDGIRLKPHAKIRWRAANTFAPQTLGPLRQTVEIYIYQDRGYATIEAAAKRLKALLHDTYMSADDAKLNHIVLTTISGELPAPEYGDAPLKIVRFSVTHA